MSEYNQRMLLILRNRGFDDSKIAQMIGASRTTVNQIINGKRSGRNIEPQIRKLAQVMNLADEVEASNTIIRIPATSIKTPPEPTTLAGKIKEGAKGAWEQVKLNAYASTLEYEEQRKERNRTARGHKPRQHDTQQEPPLPKASKVKPDDIVEITRTGRPKRKPTSQGGKLWKRADKLASHYPSTSQMVRRLMGVDTPETPDTEEQESLIKLKTLPDGRLSVGIKQDAQWCIYCQRRPGTMLLQYGQGFICRECSRNHSSDPRVVYR